MADGGTERRRSRGTWVSLEVTFAEHPKIHEAGPNAAWLYVCGLCYCGRVLSDGFIPASVVPRLTDLRRVRPEVDRLVQAGLWDAVEGGYHVHDYLEHQESADDVRARRKATAERVARHRQKTRDDAPPSDDSDAEASAKRARSVARTVTRSVQVAEAVADSLANAETAKASPTGDEVTALPTPLPVTPVTPTPARAPQAEAEKNLSLSNGRSATSRASDALPDDSRGDPTILGRLVRLGSGGDERSAAVIRHHAAGLPDYALARALESLLGRRPRPRNPAGYVVATLRSLRAELGLPEPATIEREPSL